MYCSEATFVAHRPDFDVYCSKTMYFLDRTSYIPMLLFPSRYHNPETYKSSMYIANIKVKENRFQHSRLAVLTLKHYKEQLFCLKCFISTCRKNTLMDNAVKIT